MEELKAVDGQPEHSGGRAERAHRRIDDGGRCCSDFGGAGTPHHEDDGIRLAGSGEHLSGRRRKLEDQTSALESSACQTEIHQRRLAAATFARRRHAGRHWDEEPDVSQAGKAQEGAWHEEDWKR